MNRIKELRKKKGISVKDLADKMGVSQSMLTNYENGGSMPRDNEIWEKLADYFGVTQANLMGLTRQPTDFTTDEFDTENIMPIELEVNTKDMLDLVLIIQKLDAEDIRKLYEFALTNFIITEN